MVNNVQIAIELGYLSVPDGVLIEPDELGRYPDDQVLILTTGSQGEPMAGLSRMASNNHRSVSDADSGQRNGRKPDYRQPHEAGCQCRCRPG